MSLSPKRDTARLKGFNAIASAPLYAPNNPYDEDKEPEMYQAWDEGADEAGISTRYNNGVLIT